ncbi:uncharacterized protein si:dkey-200l5.4 [Brachionichthys hirsutus]|uniref:uncharacterized protein si:dkey-200l5.4 n=1 Tax=Brachionichthys hirsutus TaxID=412623 RepID=UPI003604B844
MRAPLALFVVLATAGFYSTLSASLESAEEEAAAAQDELAELKKIDQMEFEVAQKNEAAHVNATEELKDDTRQHEAAQVGSVEERTVAENHGSEGGGDSDSAIHEESQSGSSEEADEQHDTKSEPGSRVDEASLDSTKEQDALE